MLLAIVVGVMLTVSPSAGGRHDRFAVRARVRAVLDPARGEGGELGWCAGLFRGTVTYFEGFACPPKGTCHPPHGFPTRKRVVARFSFRVVA
jgi:hypothetical protein